jgi:hypothetical protein
MQLPPARASTLQLAAEQTCHLGIVQITRKPTAVVADNCAPVSCACHVPPSPPPTPPHPHAQAGFESQSEQGAFEDQYKKLLEEIQQIYEQAKEFHSKVNGKDEGSGLQETWC